MGIPQPSDWRSELRRIHEDVLSHDWDTHVDRLNVALGLAASHALGLSVPGLAPLWFQGDV